MLHDIGKIAVPDGILHKPGPLSPDEWKIMRTHPAVGRRLIEHMPFLRGAVPVVYHHHERWDGTGYPDGLRGEDIPLGARIFAVADAFDAMTYDRPYSRAIPVASARAEIEPCAERLGCAFSSGIHGPPRFRINVSKQRGTVAAAFRRIPYEIPPPDQIGLPPAVVNLTKLKRGLVLVTGATGQGKSPPIASLL